MLEYRRPAPSPGPEWWHRRSWELWERRAPDRGPLILAGPEQVVARSDGGTVSVRIFARASTAYVELTMRMRAERPRPAFIEDYERPETVPDAFLRLGVRFSDGGLATNLPGFFWTAPADGPLFLGGHEWGAVDDRLPERRRKVYALRWHLWPVPPPGPLTVACAWPAHGVAESSVVLDGDAVHAASEASAAKLREQPVEPEDEEERPWWSDRTETDEPIAWSITAWLRPGSYDGSRGAWDPIVARIAEQARVEHWDGDQLDGWLLEYEAARRKAAPAKEFGWFSYYRGAYRLELTEVAATETAAREQAEQRLALPERWGLTLDVEPAA